MISASPVLGPEALKTGTKRYFFVGMAVQATGRRFCASFFCFVLLAHRE
jgi:hypothetical protein